MPDRYGETDTPDLDTPPVVPPPAAAAGHHIPTHLTRAAIDNCDHRDHDISTKRGRALVQAELDKIRQRKANRTRTTAPQ